ncbi:hypothetical protein SRHO_G00314700 [Serrasalmus rhombeus]
MDPDLTGFLTVFPLWVLYRHSLGKKCQREYVKIDNAAILSHKRACCKQVTEPVNEPTWVAVIPCSFPPESEGECSMEATSEDPQPLDLAQRSNRPAAGI